MPIIRFILLGFIFRESSAFFVYPKASSFQFRLFEVSGRCLSITHLILFGVFKRNFWLEVDIDQPSKLFLSNFLEF